MYGSIQSFQIIISNAACFSSGIISFWNIHCYRIVLEDFKFQIVTIFVILELNTLSAGLVNIHFDIQTGGNIFTFQNEISRKRFSTISVPVLF